MHKDKDRKVLALHERRQTTRGQTIAEFAFVFPIFILLVLAVMEYGRIFYVQMAMQNAVRQAGRFAVTGNHLPDPNNPNRNLSRIDSIIKTAKEAAPGIEIKSVKIESKHGGAGSAGGPGDTVTISVTTDLSLITPLIGRFFTPNGRYEFVSSVSFRNEPFPPRNTE